MQSLGFLCRTACDSVADVHIAYILNIAFSAPEVRDKRGLELVRRGAERPNRRVPRRLDSSRVVF